MIDTHCPNCDANIEEQYQNAGGITMPGIVILPTPTPYKHFIPTPTPFVSVVATPSAPAELGVIGVMPERPSVDWMSIFLLAAGCVVAALAQLRRKMR
jgi:hypothetical protein